MLLLKCSINAHVTLQLGHVPADLDTFLQPLLRHLRCQRDVVMRKAIASAVAHLVIVCGESDPSAVNRHATLSSLPLCNIVTWTAVRMYSQM